ncbi:MAG TPA: hypothetical protein VF590_20000, partial [Isosphaeraceae bacterium]
EYLDPADPPGCEAAAMALGRSRLAGAFEPLKGCLQRCHAADLRQQLFLAFTGVGRARERSANPSECRSRHEGISHGPPPGQRSLRRPAPRDASAALPLATADC